MIQATSRTGNRRNAPEIYATGETLQTALVRTIVADVKHDFDDNITRSGSMDWTNFNVRADQLTETAYKN